MKPGKSLLAVCALLITFAPAGLAQTSARNADRSNANTLHLPSDYVVCTGWHALCSASDRKSTRLNSSH